MTLLTATEREVAWVKYMEDKSSIWESFGSFNKHQLLIAIGEVDAWIEAGSKGQLKNNLSEPCKSELTASQITDLGNYVTNKRQGEF